MQDDLFLCVAVCCSVSQCVAVCGRSYCLIGLFGGAVVQDDVYKNLLGRKAQCTRRNEGTYACHTYE